MARKKVAKKAERGVGRPSVYKPEYCEIVEAALADGYSVAGAAGKIGVCVATVKNWVNDPEKPEFLAAVKRGQAKSIYFWEGCAVNSAKNGTGNPTVIIFGLKNRAKEEWRDISTREVTGADGEPIQMITRRIIDPVDESGNSDT